MVKAEDCVALTQVAIKVSHYPAGLYMAGREEDVLMALSSWTATGARSVHLFMNVSPVIDTDGLYQSSFAPARQFHPSGSPLSSFPVMRTDAAFCFKKGAHYAS